MVSNELPPDSRIHPRLLNSILDAGSWTDDAIVQEMWGGLLASSCTPSGQDDSNLLFINLLANMTKIQAKVLRFACEQARKFAAPNGLPMAEPFEVDLDTLQQLTGEMDIHRLDREMDHLRAMELLEAGFDSRSPELRAHLTPTALGLHLYVRCQGVRCSPVDYFRLTDHADDAPQSGLA